MGITNDKDLTPHSFWNITDFGYKCPNCETINRIAFEDGELNRPVLGNHCFNPVFSHGQDYFSSWMFIFWVVKCPASFV
jgi:hypothetical protein